MLLVCISDEDSINIAHNRNPPCIAIQLLKELFFFARFS